MNDVTMTIDGVAVATEATFEVIDPATGTVNASAPDCTASQLDAAMDALDLHDGEPLPVARLQDGVGRDVDRDTLQP